MTTRNIEIERCLKELEELVTSIENDLCAIDNIDECICPNNDKDLLDYLTKEQWNERQQIMNSLYCTICKEFPFLIKDDVLKEYKI